MRLIFPVLLLLLSVAACREKKSLPEDELYMRDSTCISLSNTAIVTFRHLSVEDIISRLKSKIDSIEVSHFSDEDFQNMKDSIIKNVFHLQKALAKGDLTIDSVNLQWNKTSTRIYQSTYQKGDGFEIGYEFTPCVRQFISERRTYRSKRRGEEIPYNPDSVSGSIDEVEAADCLFILEIAISVRDKPPFFGNKPKYYHVVFQDTATVYAIEGCLGYKRTL